MCQISQFSPLFQVMIVLVKEVFISSFSSFFISFREIKKLNGPKNEKLEAPFHELFSFGIIPAFGSLES
jgi:hypothetical protein